jgi:hypothetical protein
MYEVVLMIFAENFEIQSDITEQSMDCINVMLMN